MLFDTQPDTGVFEYIQRHSQDMGISDWAENHDYYLYGTNGLQQACLEVKLQQAGILPEQALVDEVWSFVRKGAWKR